MFSGTPILSRLLALTLFLCVFGLLPFTAWQAIGERRSTQHGEIARAERLLAEFQERRADIASLRAVEAGIREDATLRQPYLRGDNPTLAAARLQARIQSLVEAAGGRVTSTQILDPDTGAEPGAAKRFPRIGIRSQLQIDIEQLRQVFHAIESSRPYLFVDGLTIRAPVQRRSRRAAPQSDGTLVVTFDAFGYLWTGET